MNNSIEYSGLYWMNIFLNEYFGFCFEWIFFWMNILDFVLNWILNWIIFRPNSMKKWIFKMYRTGLMRIQNNIARSYLNENKLMMIGRVTEKVVFDLIGRSYLMLSMEIGPDSSAYCEMAREPKVACNQIWGFIPQAGGEGIALCHMMSVRKTVCVRYLRLCSDRVFTCST